MALKRETNRFLKSELVEEKSYTTDAPVGRIKAGIAHLNGTYQPDYFCSVFALCASACAFLQFLVVF